MYVFEKNIIEEKLNDLQLEEAFLRINEYEEICSNDMDLIIYKIIYYIYSSNFEKAKVLAINGIKKYPICGDIYYNLAYIYIRLRTTTLQLMKIIKNVFIYIKLVIKKISETNISL